MERLKIITSVGLFRVPTDDIAYIEASGNYCDVHLFNGESVTMTFQLHYFVEAFNKLKQNFFTRVGKSLSDCKHKLCLRHQHYQPRFEAHGSSHESRVQVKSFEGSSQGVKDNFGTGKVNDYEIYRR